MSDKPASESEAVDYEALAYECLGWLDFATLKLRHNSDWMGNMRDKTTGECYSWQEGMARTMEKFPDVEIDRRAIEAQYLPAKERRKVMQQLWEEQRKTQGEQA
jgi:hypothetical protein